VEEQRPYRCDNKSKWIGYMTEKLMSEGKPREEAQKLAEARWWTYYGNTFIVTEYR
jgi:hypothetical protein